MPHTVVVRVVGYGTPKTYRPRCRTCDWQGSNTTSKVAANKQAARHYVSTSEEK